jgi:outer membrane phospholipase A
VHKTNFKKRREEIEQKRLKAQQETEKEMQKKLNRQIKEKEELTMKLASFGLWISSTEVEKGLHAMHSRAKRQEALKIQISFCQKVLDKLMNIRVYFISHTIGNL